MKPTDHRYFWCVILALAIWQPVFPQAAQRARQPAVQAPTSASLKKALEGKFYLGAALNSHQISGRDTAAWAVLKEHFNGITAENVMKAGRIQPREGAFHFELADRFVALGVKEGMHIHGHTLIWHSQAPRWFFTDSEGKRVSREVLIQRMKDHIFTVVGRYRGKVHSWDVVNEALLDDGSFRKSPFYEIIGEDYIQLAFEFARQADPDAALYYNDYSMANPAKRAGVVSLVKRLQQAGAPIDGIGMQGHIGLSYPSLDEFEKSIVAFAGLGLVVMITELDLTVLPTPRHGGGAEISANFNYRGELDPYVNELPETVALAAARRYQDFFRLFLKHHERITRVTLWGINDGHSWRNHWPVRGRTDYPLLFDRNNNPKAAVELILSLTD